MDKRESVAYVVGEVYTDSDILELLTMLTLMKAATKVGLLDLEAKQIVYQSLNVHSLP